MSAPISESLQLSIWREKGEEKKTKGCICNEVPNWNSIIHTLSLAQLSVLTCSTADMCFLTRCITSVIPGLAFPALENGTEFFVTRYYICRTMIIIRQLSSNYPHSEDHFCVEARNRSPFLYIYIFLACSSSAQVTLRILATVMKKKNSKRLNGLNFYSAKHPACLENRTACHRSMGLFMRGSV